MFKTNGRLSVKDEGVMKRVIVNADGTCTVVINDNDYIVSSKDIMSTLTSKLGKKVVIEGYESGGKLHANIVD